MSLSFSRSKNSKALHFVDIIGMSSFRAFQRDRSFLAFGPSCASDILENLMLTYLFGAGGLAEFNSLLKLIISARHWKCSMSLLRLLSVDVPLSYFRKAKQSKANGMSRVKIKCSEARQRRSCYLMTRWERKNGTRVAFPLPTFCFLLSRQTADVTPSCAGFEITPCWCHHDDVFCGLLFSFLT